jgi:hypothetical protein
VYVAHTSDGGTSWHGFPALDEPPRDVAKALEAMARAKGEESQLKKWLKRKW